MWWYLDGLSECRRYGVTVIAFVGSVFSPYYHFSGRIEPENHVCINVALYSFDGHRWAMTERGRSALRRNETRFQVGASSLQWVDGGLTVEFDETSLPRPPAQWLPKPIKGRLRINPKSLNERVYTLDQQGKHHWRPIAPLADIEVSSDHFTDGGWRGEGYVDTNQGSEPLEDGFTRWDWARGVDGAGNGIVLYDALCRDGGEKQLGLRFTQAGKVETFEPATRQRLKRGFWGVSRSIQSDADAAPRDLMVLEDSPFYTRTMVENHLDGEALTMIHETFDGRRLANPAIKLMLPVRMPRRAKWPA